MEINILEKPFDIVIDKVLDSIKNLAGFQIEKINYERLKSEAFNRLNGLDQVKTINDFGDSISLYDFFVPPKLIDFNRVQEEFFVDSVSDLFCHKKILISGIVGQGKSILMPQLAIQESFKGNFFPIFTELRELENNESLESFMRRHIKLWLNTDNDKIVSHLMKEGKVYFFFDGFDEIKTSDMDKIVKDFEKVDRKYPNLNFIVSSRPEVSIDKSTIFKKYVIKKLELVSQINVIEKLVKDNFLQKNLVNALKKSNQDIVGILVTPLMVNFYVYLYKTEQIIGDDLKLFYNKLFDLVSRKHDGTKLMYKRTFATKLTPEDLENAFECICFMSCKQSIFFLPEYTFREIVEKTINFNKMGCTVDDLIKDLTTGLCFISKESESYAFMHTSIAEFFGAKFAIKHKNIDGVFEEIINNFSKYKNLINYIELIDPRVFHMDFLSKILSFNYDYFKSKRILNNLYISSKYYNKSYSKEDMQNFKENKISILVILKKIFIHI